MVHEECGIVGVHSDRDADAVSKVYQGLLALQHRGQESAGIAFLDSDDNEIYRMGGMGKVQDVFDVDELRDISAHSAIGHVRYSTSGSSIIEHVQPLLVRDTNYNDDNPFFAVAHNGNLVGVNELREYLEDNTHDFDNSLDSNIIGATLKLYDAPWEERLNWFGKRVEGAYALLVLTHEGVFAMRDRFGFRPLVASDVTDADGYKNVFFASETCALVAMGVSLSFRSAGRSWYEIAPGSIVGSRHQESMFDNQELSRCAFETVYFSRPDSHNENHETFWQARYKLGQALAKSDASQFSTPANMIIGVPDSSIPHALGFANTSGIAYTEGLVRNRYVGRTFIHPTQAERSAGVRQKYSAIEDNVRGKDLIVVDDSLVRGTTMQRIVKVLREAGARNVHVRIASPQVVDPCYYGIDIDNHEQLISHTMQKNVSDIKDYIGADSLLFLNRNNLLDVIAPFDRSSYCTACFGGGYRLDVEQV